MARAIGPDQSQIVDLCHARERLYDLARLL